MKADSITAEREPPPFWLFLVGLVTALAFLYWARPVLIPVALSILLVFLLSPLADGLQRILPRVVSVVVVVLIAFSILAAIGWITARQITSFADELPQYKDNITEKISDLRRLSKSGPLEKVQRTVDDIKKTVEKDEARTAKGKPPPPVGETKPPPRVWPIPFGGLVEFLTSAGLVVFLVIFMLMEREDLRNRIIRLVGYGRMNVTTKALEEIGRRIGKYLQMQSLINGTYGLAIATGLFFIGLPYALLWGFLAAIFRFIPYVGPWVGALLPTALGLAVFPGWLWPLAVVALFIGLELCTSMIMEPLLYGHSAGVSQVALLVAIAFWTWLWGPAGLLMATPMTVCLVVLGKYIPQFQFIVVLMSDEPVMETELSFYQRLLASDREEAARIVQKHLREHSPEEVYDDIFLPALHQAKQDYRRGKLGAADARSIFRAARKVMRAICDVGTERDPAPENGAAAAEKNLILAFPARDRGDAIALEMLQCMIDPGRCRLEIVRPAAADISDCVSEKRPALVCIGALAPGGVAQARHLCKKLRGRFPDLKILVGRWGLTDFDQIEAQRKLLLTAGSDEVAATLRETRDRIEALVFGAASRADGKPQSSGIERGGERA